MGGQSLRERKKVDGVCKQLEDRASGEGGGWMAWQVSG